MTPIKPRISKKFEDCNKKVRIRQIADLFLLRAIFEALGAEVKWDGATKTVTAKKMARK